MTTKREYREHNDLESIGRAVRARVGVVAPDGVAEVEVKAVAEAAKLTLMKVVTMVRAHPVGVAEHVGARSARYVPSHHARGRGTVPGMIRLEGLALR